MKVGCRLIKYIFRLDMRKVIGYWGLAVQVRIGYVKRFGNAVMGSDQRQIILVLRMQKKKKNVKSWQWELPSINITSDPYLIFCLGKWLHNFLGMNVAQ